jgi:Synergist-CTERM protein sorting domain-containing protein
VLVLNPFKPSAPLVKTVAVLAVDGGNASASAASINASGTLLMVSENLSVATGGVPWLHLVTGFDFDGGGSTPVNPPDAGGGNPHIPVVPPGPGLNIAPSGGCSTTAGIAPFFLALLVPLVVRRHRR